MWSVCAGSRLVGKQMFATHRGISTVSLPSHGSGDAAIRHCCSRSPWPHAFTTDRVPGPASPPLAASTRTPAGPRATCNQVPCCQPGLVVSSSTAQLVPAAVVDCSILACGVLACYSYLLLPVRPYTTRPYIPPTTPPPWPYPCQRPNTPHCPPPPPPNTALICLPPLFTNTEIPPAWDCACKPPPPETRDRRHRLRPRQNHI